MVAAPQRAARASPPSWPRALSLRASATCARVRLARRFDAVVSLFHVMSYQTSNARPRSRRSPPPRAPATAAALFVFDFWYGPAVLTDRPVVRVKELADERTELIRIAKPHLLPNDNCVDVHYRVLLTERATQAQHRIEETHRMRYLFLPELQKLTAEHGLRIAGAHAGQTLEPLDFDAWTGTLVAVRT